MAIGKITKIEGLLLGLTTLFLCGLLALDHHDRTVLAASGGVETELEAAQESFMPDVSPIDLNTAGAEDLARLPGIGEALAERIVAYREANGPFENIDEIMEVSGIGEGKFADLRDRITVGNEVME